MRVQLNTCCLMLSEKCLKCISFYGHFRCIFRENYVLYVVIYTLLSILCLVWLFYVIYRFLDHFTPNLILKECIRIPHGWPWVAMSVERKKNRRMLSRRTPRFDHGGCHDLWCLYFPQCFLFSPRIINIQAVFNINKGGPSPLFQQTLSQSIILSTI